MGGSRCGTRGSTTSGDFSGGNNIGPQVVRTFRKHYGSFQQCTWLYLAVPA